MTQAVDLGAGQPIDSLLMSGGAMGTASAAETPFYAFTLAAPQMLTITANSDMADR